MTASCVWCLVVVLHHAQGALEVKVPILTGDRKPIIPGGRVRDLGQTITIALHAFTGADPKMDQGSSPWSVTSNWRSSMM